MLLYQALEEPAKPEGHLATCYRRKMSPGRAEE